MGRFPHTIPGGGARLTLKSMSTLADAVGDSIASDTTIAAMNAVRMPPV
jgi:hypothetical protein